MWTSLCVNVLYFGGALYFEGILLAFRRLFHLLHKYVQHEWNKLLDVSQNHRHHLACIDVDYNENCNNGTVGSNRHADENLSCNIYDLSWVWEQRPIPLLARKCAREINFHTLGRKRATAPPSRTNQHLHPQPSASYGCKSKEPKRNKGCCRVRRMSRWTTPCANPSRQRSPPHPRRNPQSASTSTCTRAWNLWESNPCCWWWTMMGTW